MIDKIQASTLDIALDYVLKTPTKNFSKLVDWAERFDITDEYTNAIQVIRPIASDMENTWNRFIVNLYDEVDHEVLKSTVRNFFVNASLAGTKK